jgi:hypothetical protein
MGSQCLAEDVKHLRGGEKAGASAVPAAGRSRGAQHNAIGVDPLMQCRLAISAARAQHTRARGGGECRGERDVGGTHEAGNQQEAEGQQGCPQCSTHKVREWLLTARS